MVICGEWGGFAVWTEDMSRTWLLKTRYRMDVDYYVLHLCFRTLLLIAYTACEVHKHVGCSY